MNVEAFKLAYSASRNGTNGFHYQPYTRKFSYSDGCKECFNAGCWWLHDILATECAQAFYKSTAYSGIVNVNVFARSAEITLTIKDNTPPIWSRAIVYADLPDGTWKFMLSAEDYGLKLLLLTEY